jgi:hypothetical protein
MRLTESPASMTAFDSSPAVSRSRCSGEPRHRRVAAVLDATDHRAYFFQVFPRLTHSRASRLERIGGFVEGELEDLGRWQPIDEPEPSCDALPRTLQHESILAIERRQIDGAGRQGRREIRARACSAGSDNRTNRERSSAAARRLDSGAAR